MVLSTTLFILLQFFSGAGFSRFSSPSQTVHVKDLLGKLTSRDAVALLGRIRLIDSTAANLSDPSVEGDKPFLDSVVRRHKSSPLRVTQLIFGPISFEGLAAKVTIYFIEDTSYVAMVSIPYPFRSHATLEDFARLSTNMSASIGEPAVSSETYLNYMINGLPSVFGTLKDGQIAINILQNSN